MSIITRLASIFKEPKRAPIGSSENYSYPVTWNTAQYVQAYGEIGWVYACVSRIAQAVGDATYHMYEGKPSDKKKVEEHALLDLLDRCTPFHTHEEAFEIGQTYMELLGEMCFLIFRDGLSIREFWPIDPRRISVVPDPKQFIKGYVFLAYDGVTKVPLNKEDVFFLKTPNPNNKYRGMGIIQSIMVDVEGEKYSAMWNRNFFLNGGSAGAVIEAPGTISDDDYERLKKQYNQGHEGYANAHKLLILQGGAKWHAPEIGQKEMDFGNLRGVNRTTILGAFGMPGHILGLEESTNRATAESAEFVFARWIIKPRLNRIAGKINEMLLPQFPKSEGLRFQFDDPTPEDKAFALQLARDGFTSGFITRNEARRMQGLNELGDVGDVFMVPVNLMPQMMDEEPLTPEPWTEPIAPEEGSKPNETPEVSEPKKGITAEIRWDVFVKRLTPMESNFANWFKGEVRKQEKDTLSKLTRKNLKTVSKLYDPDYWANDLANGARPLLRAMLAIAGEAAAEEVGSMWDVNNPRVLEWLGIVSMRFGIQETKTLSAQITQTLQQGYQLGETMPQLTKRIETVFGHALVRAETIARTEMVGSSNWGALESYRQSGVVREKQWLAAIDERTRDTHIEANGQSVDLDDDFTVGGFRGPCPGQIGVPSEDINCRCTIVPIVRR